MQPPNIPKRGQKKNNILNNDTTTHVNMKSNNSLCANTQIESDNHDLRDSGISMSDQSNLNNFNNTCYEDFDLHLHQQEMNINSSPNAESPKAESPPPIPPKSNLSLNSSFDFGNSLERKKSDNTLLEVTADNYSEPKIHNTENGGDNS